MKTYKIIATSMTYPVTVARISALNEKEAIRIYKAKYPKDKAVYVALRMFK